MKRVFIILSFLLIASLSFAGITLDGKPCTTCNVVITTNMPQPTPTPIPTPTPTPTPLGINMTITGRQPLYLMNQMVPASGATNYYMKMDKNYNALSVMLESQDWDITDMDLIISNKRQPLCSEIVRTSWSSGINGLWYGPIIGRSNETITMRTTIPAGTIIYATVCNFTKDIGGKFRLSWSAF